MRSRLAASGPTPLRALVVLQLVALLVVGLATVWRFQIWAAVDERAHFDYVHKVAEEGRLPRIDSPLSPEVLAVRPGDAAAVRAARTSVERDSYEAFQPPLYYVAAAPALLVGGEGRSGLYAVRAFGLLLLLAAVAALADLCRLVAGRRWLAPFAAGLAVLLWPGVVARTVTVSNAALELLLVLLLLGQLWRARAHRDDRALALAGGLLGLALLTKLTTIYLVPLLVIVAGLRLREAHGARTRAAAAVALALPALLLAPWIASNLDRYGAPTPNRAAQAQQTAYFEAALPDASDPTLVASNRGLIGGVVPQEWEIGDDLAPVRPVAAALAYAVFLAFAAAVVVAALRRDRRWLLLLAGPFVLGALMANATFLLADWYIFLPRYLHPALLALALLAGAVAVRLRHGERVVAAGAGLATALAGVVWFYGAGARYFTDVGDALGI